ncbi:hypothetical protein N9A45_00745 [bacterium]|nr:hypothetical protein [bacterium]
MSDAIDLISSDDDSDDFLDYSDDSASDSDDETLTDVQKARKAAGKRFDEQRKRDAERKQQAANKRKHEDQAVHMDEYDIVQTHWNAHYGSNCVTIQGAVDMFTNEQQDFDETMNAAAHPSGFDPTTAQTRLTKMKQDIAFMQSLLHDQRASEKRQLTERKFNDKIEKALKVIETLRADERNIRHIRQAQHNKNELENMLDHLTSEQKARFERAKEHAAKKARVNLNRRYM